MIEVSGLQKTYRMGKASVHALQDVSLKIEAGEFVALMGPSGSGKSTLMHVLGLLDVPDAGTYRLQGRNVGGLTEDERAVVRGRTVGFVFQQFNLLPRATAVENVALPFLYTPVPPRRSPAALLTSVGLGTHLSHTPSEMSGGQQQRVAIARALGNSPAILLADEPTGNLDSKSQDDIMALLEELNRAGLTVVLVTHELDVARHARRVIRLRDGAVVSDDRTGAAPRSVSAVDVSPPLTVPGFRLSALWIHVREAFRSLGSNKVRSGLSLLGILIGVAAVVAMLALGTGARKAVEAQLSSLGANLLVLMPGSIRSHGVSQGAGAVTRFTETDARDIPEEIHTVTKTAPSVTGMAQLVYGNKNWRSSIIGTVPAYGPMRAITAERGRFFTEEEVTRRARVAVLGVTPARELFGDADPLGEYIKINRVNFQVIGVLKEKGAMGWRNQNDIVGIPLTTAMRRLMGKDYVDMIDVEVENAAALAPTEKALRAFVLRRHRLTEDDESFDVLNLAEIQSAFQATSRTLSLLLAVIAAISLFVGGIGIMNIMLVTVTERTREIGLRKALGARPRDIQTQFLTEALVISLAGGISGLLLGAGVSFALSRFAGWAVGVSVSSVALAFFFSVGVGILFGFWPARKAAALNSIRALRYE
ncbi:MAG: ABC transporter permease [Elusimicrobia bacterium]|nr:ABC transporter permease [Elusimicrobiota bacterium]